MMSARWRSYWIGFAGAGALAAVALVMFFWPEPGDRVTRETLQKARETWRRGNVGDYDLELRTSGLRDGLYRIEVRGGHALKILVNGQPGDPKEADDYTVEGLFRIVEEELDNTGRGIFGQGKDVWLWMRTDPVLGYPVTYIRQVSGTVEGITLEVKKFERR